MDHYRIVYFQGDRSKIAVADMYSYEEGDYDIASRQVFSPEREAEAYEYAYKLAEENGLELVMVPKEYRKHKLLD